MQVGDEELLHRWKVLAGDTSARPWTSNDVGGFLQLFRPHGVGLAAALEGVASASALLPRLLEVYRVTAPGWEEQDAYFVVKQPTPWPSADAHRATKDHFQKIRQIAEEIGNKDVLELLTPLPEITLAKGSAPWPPGPDDPESLVNECVTDFVASLSAKDGCSPVPARLHAAFRRPERLEGTGVTPGLIDMDLSIAR
jgi:hypothetical protein